ncbi:hypothetical protein FBU30_009632 [Linnemannia zychae]|nr:hypothetical protein FBU30_009632 [Linnemannia zychae]
MDIPPPAALRKIARDVHAMIEDPPEGIRMILSEDMSNIQAWIQGPEGTPYAGGSFRLRVQLNSDFPNSPPKCFFVTKIFHPNVSKQGEVCVSTLKKDWKKTLGLKHILLVVKCLLIVPNPESALNEEAGRQLLERYDDYARHAKLMTSIHAQSAGKDIFALPRKAEADEKDSLNENDSSSGSKAREFEKKVTKEASVVSLAMKDIPIVGSVEHSVTITSSLSSSSSLSLENSSAMTWNAIPTKRKLSTSENRTEQESAISSSSSVSSCPSPPHLFSSTSTSSNAGRLHTTPHQLQQSRTILTAQRNSITTTIVSVQSKPQLNILPRQTLQGSPALRQHGNHLLQKQSTGNSIPSSDQQEQQLLKDDQQIVLTNNIISNSSHMLSPKISHNALLANTNIVATATATAMSVMSSPIMGMGPTEVSTVGAAKTGSSKIATPSASTTATPILRSPWLVAPHNMGGLNYAQPELHVDKKRALRRL